MFGCTARQLRSFILPVTAILVIPAVLLGYYPPDPAHYTLVRFLLGMPALCVGFSLMVTCIMFFQTQGGGTLAPWDPPKKLVVIGPYRYVRNPMLSGVICVNLGEALLLSSWVVFCWAFMFFAINTVYFIFSEEPGLTKRFGDEYLEYKANVPRWLPRWTPWDSSSEQRKEPQPFS